MKKVGAHRKRGASGVRGVKEVLRVLAKTPTVMWAGCVGDVEQRTTPAVFQFNASQGLHFAVHRASCSRQSPVEAENGLCVYSQFGNPSGRAVKHCSRVFE